MSNTPDFLLNTIFTGDATPLVDAIRIAIAASAQAGADFGKVVEAASREANARVIKSQKELDEALQRQAQLRITNEERVQAKLIEIKQRGSKFSFRNDPELSPLVAE